MKSFITYTLCVLLICLLSCSNNKQVVEPKGVVSFELNLPNNWNLQKLQGIDSYVGYFTDKVDTIYYDHGRMAQQYPKSLVAANKNGKILEEYVRKSVKTTIYSYTFGSNKNFVGAYFSGEFDDEITSLGVANYSDQKKVIALMKTHKFVRAER